MDKIKKILNIIGKIITIVSIIFIIKVALTLEIDFSIISNRVQFGIVAVAGTILMCISVYIFALGWNRILTVFSHQTVDYKETVVIYAKANMGKYLPGNVMHYVERNLFAASLGLEQKSVTLSTITEIVGQVCVCAIAALLFEGNQVITILKQLLSMKYIIVFIALLLIMAIALVVFRKKIISIVKGIEWKKFLKAFLQVLPIYFVLVSGGGVVMVAMFWGMVPEVISTGMIANIIAAYTVAWVIGFVVPGAPGGIGVREFVLLVLLNGVIPENVVLTGILLQRLVSILGDGLAYLISFIIKRLEINKVKKWGKTR